MKYEPQSVDWNFHCVHNVSVYHVYHNCIPNQKNKEWLFLYFMELHVKVFLFITVSFYSLGNKVKPQKTSAFSRQCITRIANLIYTCFIWEKILNLIHNNSSERVYKSRSICGYIISPCGRVKVKWILSRHFFCFTEEKIASRDKSWLPL